MQYNGVTGAVGASVLSWFVSQVLTTVTKEITSMKDYLMTKVIGLGSFVCSAVLLMGTVSYGV